MVLSTLTSVHFCRFKNGKLAFLPFGNLGKAYEIDARIMSHLQLKLKIFYGLMFLVMAVCGLSSLRSALIGLAVFYLLFSASCILMVRNLPFIGKWRDIKKMVEHRRLESSEQGKP